MIHVAVNLGMLPKYKVFPCFVAIVTILFMNKLHKFPAHSIVIFYNCVFLIE